MNTTTTKIQTVETSLEVLNQFGIELDLEIILAEEFKTGIASDINNIL